MPHQDNEAAGCLLHDPKVHPSLNGVLIYLNTEGRIAEALQNAKTSGAKILQEIEKVGPYGYRTIIIDSEGNRVAFYSSTHNE